MGREVSSEDGLRDLLRQCCDHDEADHDAPPLATVEQLALRELLRGQILDAYVREDPPARLRQYAVITTYVMRGGDAVRAARICYEGRHERTVSEWCRAFLEFAVDWLARKRQRQAQDKRSYQAALLACWNICERGAESGTPAGGGDVCATCPLRDFR